MQQIQLAFCFVSEDWLLCFLLIGQLKVCFHFWSLGPLQKVISRAKLFALHCLLWGIPSPLWQSQTEGKRVGNISSRFIERSINCSLLPLTLDPCWPPDIMLPAGQTRVEASRADTALLKTNNFQLTGLSLLVYICPTSHISICYYWRDMASEQCFFLS